MKMQDVSFRSVDEFLEFLPDDERRITEVLRKVVLDIIPEATEKLNYNVPYYKRHKNICFIWPASVLWGKRKTRDGVRFGFTSGYLLTDESGWLARDTRKQVYWRDFKSVHEIDVARLKAYLCEAVLVDQQQKK